MDISMDIDIGNALKRFAELRQTPIHTVILNFARDFSRAAYKETPTASKSKSEFWYYRGKDGQVHYLHDSQVRKKISAGKRKTTLRRHIETSEGTKLRKVRISKGWSRASWIGVFKSLGMPSRNAPRNLNGKVQEIGTASALDKGMHVRIVDDIEFTAIHPEDKMFASGFRYASGILQRNLQKLIDK